MIVFFAVVFICAVGYFIYYILNHNQIKGKSGEKQVAKVLNKLNGVLFNDYMLVDKNGKSHQIDHIFVTFKGVFVIETKNYNGTIYGKETDQNWLQIFNYGKTKNSFYNPIKQNATHCFHISSILNKRVPIYNVVVFLNGNISNINSDKVVLLNDLKNYVLQKETKLKIEDVDKIATILQQNRNEEISNKQHVENIKQNLNDIQNNICPRCGGKLVKRQGKFGEFLGCENYPKCKFKKKIEE